LDLSPVVGSDWLYCGDKRGHFSGILFTSVLPQVYSTESGLLSSSGGFGYEHLSLSSSLQGTQYQHLNYQAWSPPQSQYYSKMGSQLQLQLWNNFLMLPQPGSMAVADGYNYHHQ